MLQAFPFIFGFVVVVGGGLIFIWWRGLYGEKARRAKAEKDARSNSTTIGDGSFTPTGDAPGNASATGGPRPDPYNRRPPTSTTPTR